MQETNLDVNDEVWVPVPGWDGLYRVSSMGEIQSLRPWHNEPAPRTLRAWISRKHRYVTLSSKLNGTKTFIVARLIYESFHGACGTDMCVDHINGDPTDDRIENLRLVTVSGNSRAFKTRTVGYASKYRGVSWDKTNRKWRAKIKVEGKHRCLGRFVDEWDAAAAWNRAAEASGYSAEALNVPQR